MAFDLSTLHTSSQLTLTAAQDGWYYYFHFTKKGTTFQRHLKMPWLFSKGPHPNSNSEEPDCKVPERRKWGLSLYMERSH